MFSWRTNGWRSRSKPEQLLNRSKKNRSKASLHRV